MTGVTTDTRLEVICARRQIRDALARNARGVDRLDREMLLSSYHPGALDNHGAYNGSAAGFADWVFERHPGKILACTHLLGSSSIRLGGAAAHCETYNSVFYRVPADGGGFTDMWAYGRYVDRFERREGEWRIAERLVVFEKDRLDRVAAASAPAGPQGRRDRDDPSYALLPNPLQMEGCSNVLETLAARQEIDDLLAAFCRGVDRCDQPLILSAFHADAEIAYGSFRGGPEAFAAWVAAPEGRQILGSVHFLGAPLVSVDGAIAWGEACCVASFRFELDGVLTDQLVLGRFVDRFEQRNRAWKIAARTFVHDKDRLDPVTAQWDGPLTQATIKGVRSRADASYQALGQAAV